MLGCGLIAPEAARAQRAGENVVREASDAFGTSIGQESIGLYSESSVRGFSPVAAGNQRLEGLYIEQYQIVNPRLFGRSVVRVGLSAQGYPFPAPSGIIDYSLRTPGPRSLVSLVASADSDGGFDLETDSQFRLGGDVSVAAGFHRRRDVDYRGGDYLDARAVGVVPQWRPAENLTLRAYWGYGRFWNDLATPIVFASSSKGLPRAPRRAVGQDWARWDGTIENGGVLAEFAPRGWALRAGLFAYEGAMGSNYNDLYLEAGADGAARHVVSSDPPYGSRGLSGELRLTRTIEGGQARHLLHLSLKGRSRRRTYGGTDVVDLGPAMLDDPVPVPRPDFSYGPPNREDVHQLIGGLAYHGLWRNHGELSAGVQKVAYSRATESGTGGRIEGRERPWLWNATIAAFLSRTVAVYAGYTRGLEQIGVAPANATNKNEAPPAVITTQRDAGLRLALRPNLSLVAGLFDIRKPYYNLDHNSSYGPLGTVRHAGAEFSLSGRMGPGLNIVAGFLLMRPRVSGEAVALGIVGRRPLGQAAVQYRLNLDYALTSRWSVDLAVNGLGSRPVTRDNLLSARGRALVDLGARMRLRLGGSPATLRLQVQNLLNYRGWNVSLNGGLQPVPERRGVLRLSLDL